MGARISATFHCQQWYLEEPHISQGHQNIEVVFNATPPIIHHRLDDPEMRHSS